MVVDLPAPFSPSRAYTSPAATAKREVVDGPGVRVLLAQLLDSDDRHETTDASARCDTRRM